MRTRPLEGTGSWMPFLNGCCASLLVGDINQANQLKRPEQASLSMTTLSCLSSNSGMELLKSNQLLADGASHTHTHTELQQLLPPAAAALLTGLGAMMRWRADSLRVSACWLKLTDAAASSRLSAAALESSEPPPASSLGGLAR